MADTQLFDLSKYGTHEDVSDDTIMFTGKFLTLDDFIVAKELWAAFEIAKKLSSRFGPHNAQSKFESYFNFVDGVAVKMGLPTLDDNKYSCHMETGEIIYSE